MEISNLLEQFCEYSISFKGFSKDTIRRYRYVVTSYCKFMNVRTIAEVTEENVRQLFYYGRAKRNWSPNTFIVYHKTLLVFFRWCLERGYLQQNPASGIEVPKLAKRILPKLTEQDAAKLLETVFNYPYQYKYLRFRNHALFATFLFAGLRKQELLNLKYSDVDIENKTLFVRQGKGNKDRIVPMSSSLAQSLQRYTDERRRLRKTNPEFFSALRGNSGLTDNGLKKLVEQMNEASGVRFTVHKLRHTFATLMLEGGCDIYSLSKMMGHSSIETTTIYLSASIGFLRSQIIKHPLDLNK